MGTVLSVHVHGDHPVARVDAAVRAVLTELDRLEATFSTFRPDSAISRINRGDLHPLDAGDEVVDVLDACHELGRLSGGVFDVRHPDRPGTIDPAGFVKGWATERAARFLDDAGLPSWVLAVGGDLIARGRRPDGTPWHIAVADPADGSRAVVSLDVEDLAVATSGTAARGRHLWDGRTGARVAPWASVTVTGPSLTWADAFATTAFAMGADGPVWAAGFDGYGAVARATDGGVVTTGRMAVGS